jgi:Mg-chelatase subunit ChlD
MALIFILDRSGSMEACRDDTIGGFNAFVEDQKSQRPEDTLTLVQFDHEIVRTYENVPLKNVQPLTRETFVPRGSTALLDAIGDTIKTVSHSSPTLIILTDGEENASKTYTKVHIKDLMEQKQKDGWKVIYLGANQDAFAEAGSIGIAAANALNFDRTQTPDVFRSLSQTVSSQASTAGGRAG